MVRNRFAGRESKNCYWLTTGEWSGSVLLDNTTRGILAEFLIAAALGLHKKPRREWDEFDLRMASGTAFQVKSSAYVQSWEQSKPSVIEFGIAPHRSWNAETGEYREGVKRWANIYVFCVFTGKEPLTRLIQVNGIFTSCQRRPLTRNAQIKKPFA